MQKKIAQLWGAPPASAASCHPEQPMPGAAPMAARGLEASPGGCGGTVRGSLEPAPLAPRDAERYNPAMPPCMFAPCFLLVWYFFCIFFRQFRHFFEEKNVQDMVCLRFNVTCLELCLATPTPGERLFPAGWPDPHGPRDIPSEEVVAGVYLLTSG